MSEQKVGYAPGYDEKIIDSPRLGPRTVNFSADSDEQDLCCQHMDLVIFTCVSGEPDDYVALALGNPDFPLPILGAWHHLSPNRARDIAAVLLRSADSIDGGKGKH